MGPEDEAQNQLTPAQRRAQEFFAAQYDLLPDEDEDEGQG